VQCCCSAILVASAMQMMENIGFKEQRWAYFARKGWADRIISTRLGWEWDRETTKEGYGEDDACSEIVDICQASKWCREEARKLGFVTGGADEAGSDEQ
jgi:hypothetical protein